MEVPSVESRSEPKSSSRLRVLIVSNPHAGSRLRAEAVSELEHCIEREGLEPEMVRDLDLLTTLADRYRAERRLRAVVAAGGDGTVAEVVNRTAPGTPVTVFPLGTANLLAGYFGIQRDARRMAQIVRGGATVRLDAGRANGRVFLLMAGCGFDADVVRRLHHFRKGRHISYWTWAGPIWQSIRDYRYPGIRVICELPGEEPLEIMPASRWAFVVNMPVYAAGLSVAATARGDDGRFDVCTFTRGSLWHGLRYIGHVFLRRHHRLEDYQCVRAAKVRIEADEEVPYQLDGDPGGVLPLEIEMLPHRLTLVVPHATARARGLESVRIDAIGMQ
jgi:diacylglycerol kinase family enzyme